MVIAMGGGVVAVAALAAASVLLFARWLQERAARRGMRAQLEAVTRAVPQSTRSLTDLVLRTEDTPDQILTALARLTPFARDVETLLEQAGLGWSKRKLVRLSVSAGLLGSVTALLAWGSFLLTVVGFVAGTLLPRLYVLRRKKKRVAGCEEQLPDAISLLSRSIRSGHTIASGLRIVAEEAGDPLASEFRRVFEEQRYGMPFEDSLLALTRRVDLIDLRVMVVAILVQREVGGNLAEILDKIGGLIRTRVLLRRQMRVYTAQGRMSGYVLGLLPVAVAGVIFLLNPDYIRFLFHDPIGQAMLMGAFGLQLVGYVWMWRILQLDF